MESKELLVSVVCLLIVMTEFRVSGMSTVNTDFERYLRAINSSTTVPNVEDRIINDSYIFAFLNYSYINSQDQWVSVDEPEEKARYGEGKILNVKGLLVHVSSRHDVNDDRACKSDILGTQGNAFPIIEPWIALVRRGECTFEEKVKNVANKGAAGVIIYNDKPVMNLEKMQIKDKNRNITAVMTYQDIGLNMASIVDQGFIVFASITRGRAGIRPINTLNKTSVLFVSISFIILMIISLVWLIFYYIQRFRYLQSKDQQSRHLCSVTKRAIMKIPTKTGKGNDKDGDNDCCPICIETYKTSDCIRVLPCNHEFHKNCIDPWLIEHRTCPMCKLDVLKHYGYVFIGSEECVMELEGSYFDNENLTPNAPQSATINGSVTLQIEDWERRLSNFTINPPQVFYRHQLPERSQSSLSYVNENKLTCSITNKLGAQQGIVESMPRCSPTKESVCLADTLQKRRSRSADSRFSQGCYTRRESVETVDRSKMPSTSRKSRLDFGSPRPRLPVPDVKIQINGEGIEF